MKAGFVAWSSSQRSVFHGDQKAKKEIVNMKRRIICSMGLAVAALLTTAANAQLTGLVYENQNGNGDTDVAPIGLPSAEFSVSALNFGFDSRNDAVNGYTVGGWLATGGVGSGSVFYQNSGAAGDTMNNVYVTIKGTVSVYTGEIFSVQQDDGLTLTIDGLTVLDNPGPHSPTAYTGTYTGPTGSESVSLEVRRN